MPDFRGFFICQSESAYNFLEEEEEGCFGYNRLSVGKAACNFSEWGNLSTGDVNQIGKSEGKVGNLAAITGGFLIILFSIFAIGTLICIFCVVPKNGKGKYAKTKKE